MNKFTSPFVIAAPSAITSARLESRMHLGAPVMINLTVANNTPAAGQATLTAPAGSFPVCVTPMRLRIATSCGCWSQLVDVQDCESPTKEGEYTPSENLPGNQDPIPSDCP